MSESQPSNTDYDPSKHYEICIKGHLDPRWTDWFEGLSISHETSGNTRLTGHITDQAALHGLLAKIRDLGLPLISLVPISHLAPPNQVPPHPKMETTDHVHTSTTNHSKPQPI